ncbi:hypothetical protein [Methylobacterium sp. Leaf118]|uniref:hypothetical protein n=1 Tax=Methylobacterium sp. Leaf118 TaxID=2876562 RepID=UPI001E438B69|nr:hypothetical protein [Methylobacterium sp. Leaf118]
MSEVQYFDDAMQALYDTLLETARWRREKAVEFPKDARNLDAAETLERLASTVS